MSSFSSLPGLKYGTFFGGTSTLSPVFGLRPLRGSRFRSRKLPNPRSSIFSPRCSASMMLLNTVSTMTSECFLVRSDTRETSSTSSAFVMLPPSVCNSSLLVPQHRERGRGLEAVLSQGIGVTPETALPPAPLSPAHLSVAEVISQRRGTGARAFLVILPIGTELVVLERADAQADLPLGRAQLDDLHLVGVAHLQIDLLA